MKIEEWPIDQVTPYPNNPRKNANAVRATANSLKKFGWQQPIVVDTDGVVIVGHTRLAAAKSMGLQSVPVTVADNLTPTEVKEYRLADNKTGELAEWDLDKLALEKLDLDLSELAKFGFELPEEEDPKEAAKRQDNIEQIQLRPFEHHDYLVFLFDDQMDYMNALDKIGVKKVEWFNGKAKKVGLGRVIDGKKLLDLFRN